MKTIEQLNKIIDKSSGHHCEISNETSISLDLGITSLEFFEIIIEIEKTFNLKIDDSKLANFQTIGDVVDYIDQNTSNDDKVKKHERANGMDIAKTLCMLGLPLIHIVEQIAIMLGVFDMHGLNPEWILSLTVFGPGIFLICMGYDIKSNTPPRKLLSTGIHLILICIIFNIVRFTIPYLINVATISHKFNLSYCIGTITESDIYYVAGLFYLLLALLKKLKLSDKLILVVTLLMLAINTIITKIGIQIDNEYLPKILGNFIHIDEQSIFPILGWAIFPVIGMFMAKNPLEKKNKKQLIESLLCVIVGLGALTASLWYFDLNIFAIAVNPDNEYIVEAFNVVIQIGLALFVLYLFQLIICITKNNAVERFFKRYSIYLMPYYIIHWIIVGFLTVIFVPYMSTESIPMWVLFLLVILTIVLSLLISRKFGLRLMNFLIKITSNPFKKKHQKEIILNQMTLHELVDKTNLNNNALAYLEYNDNDLSSISRKELKKQAIKITSYLNSFDIVNEKIAVMSDKSIEWVTAFYGITYGKNIAVILNPDLPENVLINQIKTSDASVILYPKEIVNKVQNIIECLSNIKLQLSFTDLIKVSNNIKIKHHEIIEPKENDIAVMMFTSGTMGLSKCVMLSHRNLISNVKAMINMCDEHGYSCVHNTVVILPVFHAFSLTTSVLVPLYSGGAATFNKSIKNIVLDIKKSNPDYITLVPQMAKLLAKMAKEEPNGNNLCEKLGGTLTHIFCGGAAMPEDLYEIYLNSGIQLCNGYGITECSPLVSFNINDYSVKGSLGYPIPGVNVKISEQGEILVSGDCVMQGYYHNEEANANAFIDGWFKTGDLGEIDSSGAIEFKGRLKNLIILSNGENISPELIEDMISKCPYVIGNIVYDENDHLAVEIYPNLQIQNVEQEINKFIEQLNTKIPPIWKICAVHYRKEDFERTAIGKIKRVR